MHPLLIGDAAVVDALAGLESQHHVQLKGWLQSKAFTTDCAAHLREAVARGCLCVIARQLH